MTTPIDRFLVKKLLEAASTFPWSVQGMGMFRLYLSKELRLHVWDPAFRTPGVSDIHTHPWDFTSHVVVGKITDHVYVEAPSSEAALSEQGLPTHMMGTIVCGPNPTVRGASELCRVKLRERSVYDITSGLSYKRVAQEIHRSEPESYTVTIIERRFHADTEHAQVYWPLGTEWVSAEPRDATNAEVAQMASRTLERWKDVWSGSEVNRRGVIGRCTEPGKTCLACDRMGYHVEPVWEKQKVQPEEVGDLTKALFRAKP